MKKPSLLVYMYVRCRAFTHAGGLPLPASCVCMYVYIYMALIASISMVLFGRSFFSVCDCARSKTCRSVTHREEGVPSLTGRLYQTASRSGFGLVVAVHWRGVSRSTDPIPQSSLHPLLASCLALWKFRTFWALQTPYLL